LDKTKTFVISKHTAWEAYLRLKANKGAAGGDDVSITRFEEMLKDNLYKMWNQMSSGSYMPPAVKAVSIPKADGGERILGIPTSHLSLVNIDSERWQLPTTSALSR